MEIKTCEEYVLAELENTRARADAFEDTVRKLQKIFLVTVLDNGNIAIDTRPEAFDTTNPDKFQETLGLLVGLFSDRKKTPNIKVSSEPLPEKGGQVSDEDDNAGGATISVVDDSGDISDVGTTDDLNPDSENCVE